MQVINDIEPDIIIGTHAFSVSIIGALKRKNFVNVPFISIVTDFKAHYSYIYIRLGDGPFLNTSSEMVRSPSYTSS